MDEMAEPRGLRGYLAGENDGPGGESMPDSDLDAAVDDLLHVTNDTVEQFRAWLVGR
jgi:hypothetical protein